MENAANRQENHSPEKGELIELRRSGTPFRQGVIESVMPDGSGFWIAAAGVDPRLFIHRDFTDIEVRVQSTDLLHAQS